MNEDEPCIGILQPNLTGDSFDYRHAMDGIVQAALDVMVDNGAELVEVTVPGDPHGVLVEFLNESPSDPGSLSRF